MEDRKLRKKMIPESSSENERKRRTRREKKRRKKEKRKRRHHSSSNSSSDDEERSKKRRLLKEARRILKSHHKHGNHASEGAVRDEKLLSSFKALTEEDYYEKNKEFSAWLKQEHEIYFSNLSAENARRLFLDFVQAWNSGKLSEKLYSGVDFAIRTDHKWQFKGKKDPSVEREEELEFMKSLKKKLHREHKELIDELLPEATGRERLVEKRVMRKEEARLREESPDLLREQDIMGGSEDFKQRLERERARRERKAMERNEALKEKQVTLEQKEVDTMDQFKALLNVAGGKITIPKRV